MKYIYGPVPSRRLGRSLGVDPLPSERKTCNFNCIYCQLGRTKNFTNERTNFFPKNDICFEIDQAIKLHENEIDYITFVGNGEPTLYKDLKDLIVKAKKASNKPVCVITNGSLSFNEDVRDALMLADVVLPSLDAGDEKTFIKVNRPHPTLKFDGVIQGLVDLRKNFKGKFWVEVMLVKDVNDTKEELLKIKEKLDLIEPDRIDINVPIRPPAESWAKIPNRSALLRLNEIFEDYYNINFPEEGTFSFSSKDFEKELINIIQRHPMRQDQIIDTFSRLKLEKKDILARLKQLASQNKIKKVIYNEQIFWKLNENK